MFQNFFIELITLALIVTTICQGVMNLLNAESQPFDPQLEEVLPFKPTKLHYGLVGLSQALAAIVLVSHVPGLMIVSGIIGLATSAASVYLQTRCGHSIKQSAIQLASILLSVIVMLYYIGK